MEEEVEPTARNVYELQCDNIELIRQRDKLADVLRPLAECVYNDNGDISISKPDNLNELLVKAYFAMKSHDKRK